MSGKDTQSDIETARDDDATGIPANYEAQDPKAAPDSGRQQSEAAPKP